MHNLPSQRLMLKTLDRLKIQNKIKCELCIYKYKKPTIKYIVILGKIFKKLLFGKKLKNLSTCIKNSLKWTNRNYKVIKILKNIYIIIYI